MARTDQRRTILMVDDDGEDCGLVRDALRETGRSHSLHFVRNGEELFDYLQQQGEYEGGRDTPRPDLILLDLKMPCKDGRETVRELKADLLWRAIPVVALTTSTASDDVSFCYNAGVNSYVTKPPTFHELVALVESLCTYWFDVVTLPPK